MGYRDAEGPGHAMRVYRGSLGATIKLTLLTLFSAAVVVGLILTGDRGWDLTRVGLIALFTFATGVMVFLLRENVSERIVVDDKGIASKKVAMRWEDVERVERIRVNDHLTLNLHGGGKVIGVKSELRGFDELRKEIEARLGV